jgi:hypothetical protein
MALMSCKRSPRGVFVVLCLVLPVLASCASTNGPLVRPAGVPALATGGSGIRADPWTGWETSVNALLPETVVHFPAGYYAASATVNMKSGWTIMGDGWSSVLIVGKLGADVLRATGANNLTIRNLQIDATGQTGADAHGIRIINGANVLLDGLWIHHAAWDGIRLGPSGNETGTADGVRIVNSLLEHNTYMGIGATDFQNLTVTGNIMRRNLHNGMDLEPTMDAPGKTNVNARATITGNVITENAGTGINLYNWTGSSTKGFVAISGNVITQNAGGYGVEIKSQTSTVVNGNVISRSLSGVYVYGTSMHTTVNGNTISHMRDAGVRVDGEATRHTAVSGNTIFGCGVGVHAVNGADDVSVTGNQFAFNGRNVSTLGARSKSVGNAPSDN